MERSWCLNVNVLEQNKIHRLGSAACASPSVLALGLVPGLQLVAFLLRGLAAIILFAPSDPGLVGSWGAPLWDQVLHREEHPHSWCLTCSLSDAQWKPKRRAERWCYCQACLFAERALSFVNKHLLFSIPWYKTCCCLQRDTDLLNAPALLCWCGPVCMNAACGAPCSLLLMRKPLRAVENCSGCLVSPVGAPQSCCGLRCSSPSLCAWVGKVHEAPGAQCLHTPKWLFL